MKLGDTELRTPHYAGALVSAVYILGGKNSLMLRAASVAGVCGVYMTQESRLSQMEGWKSYVKDYTQPLAAGAYLVTLPLAALGLLQLPFQDWTCAGASTLGVRMLYGIGGVAVILWAMGRGASKEAANDGYTTPPSSPGPSGHTPPPVSPFRAMVMSLYPSRP